MNTARRRIRNPANWRLKSEAARRGAFPRTLQHNVLAGRAQRRADLEQAAERERFPALAAETHLLPGLLGRWRGG